MTQKFLRSIWQLHTKSRAARALILMKVSLALQCDQIADHDQPRQLAINWGICWDIFYSAWYTDTNLPCSTIYGCKSKSMRLLQACDVNTNVDQSGQLDLCTRYMWHSSSLLMLCIQYMESSCHSSLVNQGWCASRLPRSYLHCKLTLSSVMTAGHLITQEPEQLQPSIVLGSVCHHVITHQSIIIVYRILSASPLTSSLSAV